jgi:hypothetical protein
MSDRSKHFASALAEPKFALIAAVGEFTTRAPLAYSQIPAAIALILGFLAQLVMTVFGSVNQERTVLFWSGVSLAVLTLAGLPIVRRQKKTGRSNPEVESYA